MPASAATPAKPEARNAMQKALAKLGLVRDIDLALHLPLRYEDETRLARLRDARDGDTLQFEAAVVDAQVLLQPRRQLRVTVRDGDGEVCTLRFFAFYPSQQKALAPGARVRLRGELRGGFGGWSMMHPHVAVAGGALAEALTPVYPSVAVLPQAYLRKAVQGGLERADLSDTMAGMAPAPAHGAMPLWGLREALYFLHHPAPDVSLQALEDREHPAWLRLKCEELLAQQLSQLQARRARDALRAPALQAEPQGLQTRVLAALPFHLTRAQQRVVDEIRHDLARPQPMHRLLQGDVGSGKTVVAALAAAVCMEAGWQCALMAPTEILATQHFRKLVDWLEPLGVKTAWFTGGQKARERRLMAEQVASGEAALVIGTHAVIQDKLRFQRLALAIIDEQHRFGVAQRLALRAKMADAQLEPHLLMMSATPIPRTLAMSYYADLELSTIDELPPGRTPIVTRLVHEGRRDEVITRIRAQLALGRQVYWVCPLIEESEAVDLANATATHAALSDALQDIALNGVALLHSRMPGADKKVTMDAFGEGRIAVLVSTTVIEVGVDVPNASLMVIEHAERFGLSQLHQLRGRVGRGAAASACVLLYSTGDAPRLGEAARARLKAMVETGDGFEIARRDLEIRGPGEFMGARQSGSALLRFADIELDSALLAWARTSALRLWEQHPEQAQRHVERWLGGKQDYLKA